MTVVATLSGVLSLDDSDFRSGMQNAREETNTFGNQLRSVGGNVQQVGTFMLGAATAGGVAITGMVAGSVNQFSTLERGMNEVFTLLPGISEGSMDAMTSQVNRFSERMGVLPNDVVPALYQALSAGVPQNNVFDFLGTAQMAAVGGVTELETAVDGISSVINAYGSDVITATDASDLMFTAVRLGKTDFGQLSASLFNVIPTASSLGIGFDNVTAGLAAITAQGVPTSVATTQMRQMFIELGDATSDVGGAFLNVSGTSFQEFIAGGGNVSEALQLLYTHAQDTGVNIDQLFGSVEAGAASLALTGQGADRFNNFLGEMSNASGATETAYETMNSGISRSMDMLFGAFGATVNMFGALFAPAIEPVIDILTTFFRIINAGLAGGESNSDWLMSLPVQFRSIGVFVGRATARFWGFMQGINEGGGIVESAIGWLGTLITTFQAVSGAVMNVLGPIISWIQTNIALQDVLMAVGIAIGSVVIPAILTIVATAAPVVATFALMVGAVALMRNAWENNLGGIQEKVSTFVTWFTTTAMPAVVGFVTSTVIPGIQSFTNTIVEIWGSISPTLNSLYEWFMTSGMPAIQGFIVDTAIPAIESFIGIVMGIWEDVSPALGSLFDWFITGGLPLMADFVTVTFGPALDVIIGMMTGIWETVSPYLGDLYDWFMVDGLAGIETYLSGPFTTAFQGVIDFISAIWDVVQPGLQAFQDGVGEVFTWILDNSIGPVSDALASAWTAYSDFTSWSGNALSDAGNWIDNMNPFTNNQQVGRNDANDATTYAPPRAGGGEVSQGQEYWVGEREPEVFVPRESGTILNQEQMAGMGGGGFNISGVTIYANSEQGGRDAARGLYAEMQELMRGQGVRNG